MQVGCSVSESGSFADQVSTVVWHEEMRSSAGEGVPDAAAFSERLTGRYPFLKVTPGMSAESRAPSKAFKKEF